MMHTRPSCLGISVLAWGNMTTLLTAQQRVAMPHPQPHHMYRTHKSDKVARRAFMSCLTLLLSYRNIATCIDTLGIIRE